MVMAGSLVEIPRERRRLELDHNGSGHGYETLTSLAFELWRSGTFEGSDQKKPPGFPGASV